VATIDPHTGAPKAEATSVKDCMVEIVASVGMAAITGRAAGTRFTTHKALLLLPAVLRNVNETVKLQA